MAIQIVSDLHLEAPKCYNVFNIVPKATYLALLGDICNVALHKDDCIAFLNRQLKQFRAVLFVPGNYEAYYSNWPETLDILLAFERDVRNDTSLGDFILLDRTVYKMPDTNVIILGCSLFSSICAEDKMAVSLGLNDFLHIKSWDVNSHNEAHRRGLAWLNT